MRTRLRTVAVTADSPGSTCPADAASGGTGTPLGIIGAGKLGITVARLARAAGIPVNISASGDPAKIALTVRVLAPGAVPMTTAEVIDSTDVILLALPMSRARDLAPQPFKNKLLIDGMNYWWETDGIDDELAHPVPSSSELVARWFPQARVVKAFNHIGYHDLEDVARAAQTGQRTAMAIAGDDLEDVRLVACLVEQLGFAPVLLQDLHAGAHLEPGREAFGVNLPSDPLRALLAPNLSSDRAEERTQSS